MAAFNRLETARRRLDEDAFMQSPVIERLVLQVIGGWELVKSEIYVHGFTAAGFGAEWRPDNNAAQAFQKVATALRVRYPAKTSRPRPRRQTMYADDLLTY
jgi:hypothetical protein